MPLWKNINIKYQVTFFLHKLAEESILIFRTDRISKQESLQSRPILFLKEQNISSQGNIHALEIAQ